MSDCTHPSEWVDWNDERPLYCTLCDADLQSAQPVRIIEGQPTVVIWEADTDE